MLEVAELLAVGDDLPRRAGEGERLRRPACAALPRLDDDDGEDENENEAVCASISSTDRARMAATTARMSMGRLAASLYAGTTTEKSGGAAVAVGDGDAATFLGIAVVVCVLSCLFLYGGRLHLADIHKCAAVCC